MSTAAKTARAVWLPLRQLHVALVDVLKAYASRPAMLLLAFGIVMVAADAWLLVSLIGG